MAPAVTQAIRSLWEHRTRALLSMLGIMVGTSAILMLVSIATGVRGDVTKQVEEIGVNVLIVIPGRIEDGTFAPNMAGASYLKEDDAKRLAKVNGVRQTAPFTFVGGGIRRDGHIAASILAATTPAWFQMHPVVLSEGRTFEAQDELKDVCVIGSLAADSLFKGKPALGKAVQINGHPYQVLGVTKEQKQSASMFSFTSFQNIVYVPYHGLKERVPETQTDRIMIQIDPGVEPKSLVKTLDAVLGQRLDRQQYQVVTQEDLLGLVCRLMGILTWLLTGLTSIALFVGGIGIMTVMLMSVNERAKEIGVRKTVGARRADIFQQFLVEAIMLSLAGGIVALGFSYAVDIALATYTPVKPQMTWGIVGLGLGVGVLVGAVFGVLPAITASRKDPVECLREGG
ncbi:sporulation-delaying-protein transporter subunit SkiZ [soil metagenome]